MTQPLLLGEFRRALDDRFRLSIPTELVEPLTRLGTDCVLIKERLGALSLWNRVDWQQRWEQGVRLIEAKLEAGRLAGRIDEVQRIGRLISTRHRPVQLAGRGRLLVPEGFREFLGVSAGGEIMVVGAGLCVEIWRPDAWLDYLGQTIPDFHQWFDELSN